MARHNPGGHNRDGGSKRSCGGALGIRITLLSVFLLWTVGETAGDTTLETDTESLAQFYFALGGPGWQRRDGKIASALSTAYPCPKLNALVNGV